MSSAVISIDGLSKRYRIGSMPTYGRLTEVLSERMSASMRRLRGQERKDGVDDDELWALRDFSLEVNEGDVIGIVGRNGAGKTTLLKLLSRITEPTLGTAELHGRVGALLEVGTGFHPELSGRENIFLNGAVLGMSRQEIRSKFDEIVEFSEIPRFIDTPVKRYSSGMQVRLAFAVAAHFEPEILIIDEVLAVGDAAFQKKCLGKMNEVARAGRTVLFVSHNTGAVAELCNRAVLLSDGQKVTEGSVSSVLEAYSELTAARGGMHELGADPSLAASIAAIGLTDGNGTPTGSFDIQDDIEITITYQVTHPLTGLQLSATLARNMVNVLESFDTDDLPEIPRREPGIYEARWRIPRMFLKAGAYSLRLTLGTPETKFQELDPAVTFEIEERSMNTYMRGFRRDRGGLVISPGSWETTQVES